MKEIRYYFKRIWLFTFKKKHLCELTYRLPYLGQMLHTKLTLDDTQYTFEYIGSGLWYSKDKPVKPIEFETLYF